MYALISLKENILDNSGNTLGKRVAEISPTQFEVDTTNLLWLSIDKEINHNLYYYDITTNTLELIPGLEIPAPIPVDNAIPTPLDSPATLVTTDVLK